MKTKTPDSLTIQQYLEGKLDPQAAHQLEKQALDDPFLWDALEGYSVYRDPAADLSILQRQLHERIVHMQENKKVFDLSWQRLSVAAAAAVMFVSAGILFWMNSHNAPEQLASEVHKPVEVNVIDRDSVEAVIRSGDEPVIASVQKKEVDLNQPTISAYKPGNTIEKKAVISPKAESGVAANQRIAPAAGTQVRNMGSASAPSAARQAKAERLEDGNASVNEFSIKKYVAQPKSGWKAYQEYLAVNAGKFKKETALKGSVLLSFEIAPSGKVSNIKILQGLSEAYDNEAIRIVKEGPEWVPSPDKKVIEQRIAVNFGP